MHHLRLRRLSTLLQTALLGLLLVGSAHAQTLYQVELVVFARDSAEAEVEESWQRDYGLAYPKRLIGLAPAGPDSTSPAPFQLLPASARRLNNEANTLNRRSNLRVLFHGAWVQPVGGIESADPVLITGGNQYGQHRELEGYVVLTAERYLHLSADLWMTRFSTGNALDADVPVLPLPRITVQQTATTTDASSTNTATPDIGYIPGQIYAMDQERRMRSGELQYIDHPRFGLLVLATPYKAAQPPAPVAEPTANTAPISTAP